MPFNLGPGELLLLAILALLFFGPKKLPEIGKALGEGLGSLKRAMNNIADPGNVSVEPPAKPEQATKPSSEDKRPAEAEDTAKASED